MRLYLLTLTLAAVAGCAAFNKPEIGSREWWAARTPDERFQLIRR